MPIIANAFKSINEGNNPVLRLDTTADKNAVKKATKNPLRASLKFSVNSAEKFILFIYLFFDVKSDDGAKDTYYAPNNLANELTPIFKTAYPTIGLGCLNQDCIKLIIKFLVYCFKPI